MEFPTTVGGKIAEYIVEPVGRQVRYVFHYNRNVRRLQNRVAALDAARESVEHKIVEAEREGRKVETFVTNWLTDVNMITKEAKDFLKDEHQAKIKCLYGFCPNLMARHHLSRKSMKLDHDLDWFFDSIDDVEEELDVLSTDDDEAYDSRTSVVQNVMDELRNSNTDLIGVYGIGGVGKTTLVKEIYEQATTGGRLFDEVVMVLDLKLNPSIERIQKEIAEKLGINLHGIETPAGRARHLCDRIKDMKTLVILDDVWEKIDLEAVGLPRMPTLKILMTSRSKIVLSRDMDTQKEFRLDLLDGIGGGGKEKAYSAIEWSYGKLDNQELKSVFLLCGVAFGTSNACSILDLFEYSMGLGLLENVDSIGEAWNALNSLLEQLKDSCLLLDSDDNTRVRMHDLVKEAAKRIYSRDQHVLSLSYGSEFKEWQDKEFREKCTMISIYSRNIPKLPDILQCQELTLFHLHGSKGDSSREIPCNFFKEMKKLRVLDLTSLSIPSLPSSLQFLKSLRTLCLDQCTLGDIALVGQLQNLEILSFFNSEFTQLPKEIGLLIRLRLLDLTGCSQLEVISPNVLSSLKRLEHLRMRNSFNRWEVGRVISTERSNANLEELKHLHNLTALQIHIPDAHTLPADLFTSKVERFQICIGSAWKWYDVDETLNTLKLKLPTSNELDQGLILLSNKTEDLYLEGMEGVNNSIVYQLGTEGFRQQIKRLNVTNISKFSYIVNGKAMFPNLSSLVVHRCKDLRFMLSSSTARSLIQLKHLEITECQMMEEIVSSKQYGEEITGNMFPQLQHLKLKALPNLAKFCSASYIEFPSLKRLQLKKCAKLETFISHPLTKNISTDIEIEEGDSKENPETVVKYFLFDKKVGFPRLERLSVNGLTKLIAIWHNQLDPYSFRSLRDVKVRQCNGLISMLVFQVLEEIISEIKYSEENPNDIFSELVQLELNGLPNLTRFCSGSYIEFPSLERLQSTKSIAIDKVIEERETEENLKTVVPYFFFDKKVGFPKLERLTINDLPKLTKIWGSQISQNSFCKLRDVTVQRCNSLINIVPDSIARNFQQLQKLTVENCGVLEEIIAHEEVEKLMPDDFVLFPKVTCLEFKSLPQLKRFYPRMHAFNWPLLKTFELFDCRIVDIFASEFSGLPKIPDLGGLGNPVKQPFVLIKKSSFPNLEDLTLGPMDIWYGPPAPAAFCKHAVFPGIGGRHTDKTIPHLKTLRLHGMEKLMRLWEENTEPAGPVFLQLKTLEVKFSGLNNIELSAISFKNLTNLEVSFCWRLQYLTTYSVAQSLGQLKKLKVDECKSMKEILANDGVGEDASNSEIVFSRLRHLELSDLISLEWFCSRNCIVKVPLLETSALEVNCCSIKLKISSDQTLEEVDSDMHLDVQKSHSRKEEAVASTEAAGSLEKNQKQPSPNVSEGAQAVEAVIQETAINSQNMEHGKVMERNQKQVVTNTSKNLQEADFGMQESALIQPLNPGSKEGKPFQLQADSGSQLHSQHISRLEADKRHLQEELSRARETDMRDKEQKLAEERLASVDPKEIS